MKRVFLSYIIISLFFILAIAEIRLLIFGADFKGPYITPVLLFFTSLSIAVIPVLFSKYLILNSEIVKKKRSTLQFLLILVVFLPVCYWFIDILQSTFNRVEINAKVSDIIPTINILCERFLEGRDVYSEITDFGYPIRTSYLTFHWLPFIFAHLTNIDPRWIAVGILLLSFLIYLFILSRQKTSIPLLIIKIFLPIYFLIFIAMNNDLIFAITVEEMIAGYYVILGTALLTRSGIFIVAGLLLCLLSRYSLILWLPFFLALLYFYVDKKKSLKIIAYLVAGVVLLYILPFLTEDIHALKNHFNKVSYTSEWYPKYWQGKDAKPFHLFQGIGFAAFFYDFVPGDIPFRAKVNQYTHIIVSVLSISVAALFWFRKYYKNIPPYFYSLLALKFYLVFFYSFIHVPYKYLFIVHIALSFVIFMRLKPLHIK